MRTYYQAIRGQLDAHPLHVISRVLDGINAGGISKMLFYHASNIEGLKEILPLSESKNKEDKDKVAQSRFWAKYYPEAWKMAEESAIFGSGGAV